MENQKMQKNSLETCDRQDRRRDFLRMPDMHAHLLCLSEEYRGRLTEQEMLALGARELAVRRECGIDTVFSCGTPQEWEFMQKCLAEGEKTTRKNSLPETFAEGRYVPGAFPAEGKRNFDDFQEEAKADVDARIWDAQNDVALSFGIHPWYSDRFDPRDCREYFRDCPMIGEIGMDSVWCEVPLDVQRRVFAQQLEIAAELGKPVVLHTKGQEAQIAEMIRDFPGKVCVHWYSGGEEDFEKYLEMDCYFTLGPDLSERCILAGNTELLNGNAAMMQTEPEAILQSASKTEPGAILRSASLYHRMLREVPANRLFFETDGLSSIAWMRGQEIGAVSFGDISEVLEQNLEYAAWEKQMQPEQLLARVKENFREFVS